MVQCGKTMFIGRKEGIALARQYTRYYVVFENQVEHVGQERRRRFPGREGQRHPLVCVLYTREKGKVLNSWDGGGYRLGYEKVQWNSSIKRGKL